MLDLHAHTKKSDGEQSPKELIDLAIAKGIKALAITDHDTAAGLDESVKYAKDKDIIFIPGVEFDVKVPKGQMHILALGVDFKNEELKQKLLTIKQRRDKRNAIFIQELNKMGFNITIEELREVAGGNIIGKPHFAKVFLRKGYIQTKAEMFDIYFNRPPLSNIKMTETTPEELIKIIKRANGIAVLAHPQTLKLNDEELVRIIEELKSYGLDGMECYHSGQSLEQMKKFKEIANKFNLLITKGSDYHGPITKPGVELGTGINNNIVSNDDKEILERFYNYYVLKNKNKFPNNGER